MNAVPRSKPRVAMAMRQPSPGAPTIMSAGVRAPSKKTSQKWSPPVISTSGRTSMPGWCIGQEEERDALVLRPAGVGAAEGEDPVGELRLAGPDLLAVDHPLVAVESGPGGHRRQVAPGARLAEALAPELLAPEDRRQEPRPLRFRAEVDQRRSEEAFAERAAAGRSMGPCVLLGEHQLLDRRGRSTAVGPWPREPDPRRRARAPAPTRPGPSSRPPRTRRPCRAP